MSEKTESFFESASGNAVDFEMTIMESTGTITRLREIDMGYDAYLDENYGTFLDVDENDLPSDVKQELARADDEGRHYHLNVVTFKLGGEDDDPRLNWHGLGSGTYARINFQGLSYSGYTKSETNPYPEETWVHEILHCLNESLFAELGNLPAVHDFAGYGYDYNNGILWKWYRDLISGKVRDPSTGKLAGIMPYMWEHTPLGHVNVWNGHTYKFHDITATWEEAEAYCENLGGHLVTITTKEEQDMLVEMLQGLVRNDSAIWYWAGASKASGEWEWITDEAWHYENFEGGFRDWDGAYLQVYGFPFAENVRGKWFGAEDSYIHPHGFICEWDSDQVTDR